MANKVHCTHLTIGIIIDNHSQYKCCHSSVLCLEKIKENHSFSDITFTNTMLVWDEDEIFWLHPISSTPH